MNSRTVLEVKARYPRKIRYNLDIEFLVMLDNFSNSSTQEVDETSRSDQNSGINIPLLMLVLLINYS